MGQVILLVSPESVIEAKLSQYFLERGDKLFSLLSSAKQEKSFSAQQINWNPTSPFSSCSAIREVMLESESSSIDVAVLFTRVPGKEIQVGNKPSLKSIDTFLRESYGADISVTYEIMRVMARGGLFLFVHREAERGATPLVKSVSGGMSLFIDSLKTVEREKRVVKLNYRPHLEWEKLADTILKNIVNNSPKREKSPSGAGKESVFGRLFSHKDEQRI